MIARAKALGIISSWTGDDWPTSAACTGEGWVAKLGTAESRAAECSKSSRLRVAADATINP
jgi:hypothetical protein